MFGNYKFGGVKEPITGSGTEGGYSKDRSRGDNLSYSLTPKDSIRPSRTDKKIKKKK